MPSLSMNGSLQQRRAKGTLEMKKSKTISMKNAAPSHLLGPGPGNGRALKGRMPMEAYPSRPVPSGSAPKGLKTHKQGK